MHSIRLREVNIFIPFTKLEARTLLAFKDKRYRIVPIVGEFGYAEYFRERWQEGRSFINVEHDIVPDWELVTELMTCPESIIKVDCLSDTQPVYRRGSPQISSSTCCNISSGTSKAYITHFSDPLYRKCVTCP